MPEAVILVETNSEETGELPLASTKNRKRRRTVKTRLNRRQCLLLVTALAAVLLCVIGLQRLLSPRTLPEQVQSQIPSWVSQQLLTPNQYSRPELPVKQVNAVVVHYVGNPGTSAAANRSFFEGLATSGETYASSNFLVGLEGEILECVPVDEMAYCSNSRNSDTVSIEVCHPDDTGKFNSDTMASLVRLTAWLCVKFHLDPHTDVIRHYDVTGKECPLYYVRNPEAWETFKDDVAAAMAEFS